MPIASTDLVYKYSVATGPGNSTVGTALSSNGGFISTTPVPDAVLDNIFDDVTGDENAVMNVDYKCVFLHNQHATLTLQAARLWIAAEVAGGANSALALDNIGVTVLANATAQAGANTTEDTLPAGAGVFSSPTTKAGGILIGNIPAGSVVAIWLRRSATNSAAQNSDGLTFRVEGDTAS